MVNLSAKYDNIHKKDKQKKEEEEKKKVFKIIFHFLLALMCSCTSCFGFWAYNQPINKQAPNLPSLFSEEKKN